MSDYKCNKCDQDVSDLVNWETLFYKYIECPKCGHKMVVEYDESWDGEIELCYWWLEDYAL